MKRKEGREPCVAQAFNNNKVMMRGITYTKQIFIGRAVCFKTKRLTSFIMMSSKYLLLIDWIKLNISSTPHFDNLPPTSRNKTASQLLNPSSRHVFSKKKPEIERKCVNENNLRNVLYDVFGMNQK
jgi:hypothetical protein